MVANSNPISDLNYTIIELAMDEVSPFLHMKGLEKIMTTANSKDIGYDVGKFTFRVRCCSFVVAVSCVTLRTGLADIGLYIMVFI